jgi:hypothetical protein
VNRNEIIIIFSVKDKKEVRERVLEKLCPNYSGVKVKNYPKSS